MGCSASTEAGRATLSASPPIVPEPVEPEEEHDSRPEVLLTNSKSSKTELNTHSTQASSFYGFRGGGRSIGSGSDNNPRSDGSGRSFATFSSSSKDRGSSNGEKLSEKDEESDFEEDDFEDVDDDYVGKSSSSSKFGEILRLSAKRAESTPGRPATGDVSQQGGESSSVDTRPSASREVNSSSSGQGDFPEPPSPASPVGTTEEKVTPSSNPTTAEEASAVAPISTVSGPKSERVRSTSAGRDGMGPGVASKIEPSMGGHGSPRTPRTEEASPMTATTAVTLSRSATTSPSSRTTDEAVPTGLSAIPEAEVPMFVLPMGGLSARRGFPSYQAAKRNGVLVPCDTLDRSSAFVVFVSHRWVADGGDPGGGAGCGRPDAGSTKHALVLEALGLILSSLPQWVGIYVWIDCCCVDQENREEKARSARSTAAYVQQCDAVLTPYAEALYNGSLSMGTGRRRYGEPARPGRDEPELTGFEGGDLSPAGMPTLGRRDESGDQSGADTTAVRSEFFDNPLGEAFGETPWPSSYRSLQDYCSRAWCRLELLLCQSLPLADGGYRYFEATGEGSRVNERPHFLYGDYQQHRRLSPEPLPRARQGGWASCLDPLEGALSLPEDMEAITVCMPAVKQSLLSARSPRKLVVPAAGDEDRMQALRTPPRSGDGASRTVRKGTSPCDRASLGSEDDDSAAGLSHGGAGSDGTEESKGQEARESDSGGKSGRTARGAIPPPIATRAISTVTDERGEVPGSRADLRDRLMSPAVKGSRIMSSPMRMNTAASASAMEMKREPSKAESTMPGWLWETVFQYPLREGDTRTQYSDGSTFVGPLKDGMRHGKGAYFFQDGSRYEGFFLGDRRHGEGTLTLAGGGRYVGDWENDLQHGQGTFYFADSSCFRGLWHEGKKRSGVFTYSSGGRYIGELQGGRRHGRGSFLYPDGSSYEGQWQDNVKHGEGTAWYASGNRYVGQWRNGKSHGEGVYYYATGARYDGEFDHGKCQGRGTYFYANGNRYEGEWKDDMKWGFGKAVYRKKARYEGHFYKDKRHGYGRMWYANAGTYEGEWASGKPHGHGTATHKDGEKYVGTYKAGLYHGAGCYWYTNGAVYEGEYRNGRVHGKGRATFPSGDSYAGEWREGAMSGTGVYDFKKEGASYEGDFRNGRMHGVGVYRWPHGDVYRGSWQADRRFGRGRYEWTELGLTFEGVFRDDRRMGRGSIIFPDNSRYECQWENDKALDSTAEGARSVHYRADGTECSGDCDVRCKEKGGDELRRLMRRINEQRMKQPVTPTPKPESKADGTAGSETKPDWVEPPANGSSERDDGTSKGSGQNSGIRSSRGWSGQTWS